MEDESLPLLGEHLINNCGKMIVLDKLLVKLFTENHQVLLFSQQRKVLDILEDYCAYREYKYCRLDGDYNMEEKDE